MVNVDLFCLKTFNREI